MTFGVGGRDSRPVMARGAAMHHRGAGAPCVGGLICFGGRHGTSRSSSGSSPRAVPVVVRAAGPRGVARRRARPRSRPRRRRRVRRVHCAQSLSYLRHPRRHRPRRPAHQDPGREDLRRAGGRPGRHARDRDRGRRRQRHGRAAVGRRMAARVALGNRPAGRVEPQLRGASDRRQPGHGGAGSQREGERSRSVGRARPGPRCRGLLRHVRRSRRRPVPRRDAVPGPRHPGGSRGAVGAWSDGDGRRDGRWRGAGERCRCGGRHRHGGSAHRCDMAHRVSGRRGETVGLEPQPRGRADGGQRRRRPSAGGRHHRRVQLGRLDRRPGRRRRVLRRRPQQRGGPVRARRTPTAGRHPLGVGRARAPSRPTGSPSSAPTGPRPPGSER